MHIGLVIGKKESEGYPGKNLRPYLGRPSAEYAFIAAKYSKIDSVFVSTDCEKIHQIGNEYGAHYIARPVHLTGAHALTEDTLVHAYSHICKKIPKNFIQTISLLICNHPAVDVEILNSAIDRLVKTPAMDSCFSVARYDMFSPARARQVTSTGEMRPYVDLTTLPNVSSLRSSGGPVYFCDLSIQVMKPTCIENIEQGAPPFPWQGRRSLSIEVDFGFDIDANWQVPVLEYWLKQKGFTETFIPWKKPVAKKGLKIEEVSKRKNLETFYQKH